MLLEGEDKVPHHELKESAGRKRPQALSFCSQVGLSPEKLRHSATPSHPVRDIAIDTSHKVERILNAILHVDGD